MTQPTYPRWEEHTTKPDAGSRACEEYVSRMESSVRARLTHRSQGAPATGGIGTQKELHEQEALAIDNATFAGLQTPEEQ